MVLPLKPKRGGFLRAFGCAWFIREFLMGHGPFGSPVINPAVGAPQADVFFYYKNALRSTTAYDRATKTEERRARREKRAIKPENIEALAQYYLKRMPYKGFRCRFHSFYVYFTLLKRLHWVEETGIEEPSAFQDNYAPGQPRKFYRLTKAGREASEMAWANPRVALYGHG
jgi:hypothetical protein